MRLTSTSVATTIWVRVALIMQVQRQWGQPHSIGKTMQRSRPPSAVNIPYMTDLLPVPASYGYLLALSKHDEYWFINRLLFAAVILRTPPREAEFDELFFVFLALSFLSWNVAALSGRNKISSRWLTWQFFYYSVSCETSTDSEAVSLKWRHRSIVHCDTYNSTTTCCIQHHLRAYTSSLAARSPPVS